MIKENLCWEHYNDSKFIFPSHASLLNSKVTYPTAYHLDGFAWRANQLFKCNQMKPNSCSFPVLLTSINDNFTVPFTQKNFGLFLDSLFFHTIIQPLRKSYQLHFWNKTWSDHFTSLFLPTPFKPPSFFDWIYCNRLRLTALLLQEPER